MSTIIKLNPSLPFVVDKLPSIKTVLNLQLTRITGTVIIVQSNPTILPVNITRLTNSIRFNNLLANKLYIITLKSPGKTEKIVRYNTGSGIMSGGTYKKRSMKKKRVTRKL